MWTHYTVLELKEQKEGKGGIYHVRLCKLRAKAGTQCHLVGQKMLKLPLEPPRKLSWRHCYGPEECDGWRNEMRERERGREREAGRKRERGERDEAKPVNWGRGSIQVAHIRHVTPNSLTSERERERDWARHGKTIIHGWFICCQLWQHNPFKDHTQPCLFSARVHLTVTWFICFHLWPIIPWKYIRFHPWPIYTSSPATDVYVTIFPAPAITVLV